MIEIEVEVKIGSWSIPTDAEEKLNGMLAKVGDLEKVNVKVTENTGRIYSIEEDLSILEKSDIDIKTEIGTIQIDLSEVQTKQQEFESGLSDAETDINNLEEDFNEYAENTDKKIKELEDKSHEHAHSDVLEKFSEKEDGTLLYNGGEIGHSENSGNANIIIDKELSGTSENPVQNKVINTEVEKLWSALENVLPLQSDFFANDYSSGLIEALGDTVAIDICDTEYRFENKRIKKLTIVYNETEGETEYDLLDSSLVNEEATAIIHKEPQIDDYGYIRVADISPVNINTKLYESISSMDINLIGFKLYYYEI